MRIAVYDCKREERAHLGERGRSGQNTNERDDQTVQSRDRTAGRKNN